jgi:hypothetical protein
MTRPAERRRCGASPHRGELPCRPMCSRAFALHHARCARARARARFLRQLVMTTSWPSHCTFSRIACSWKGAIRDARDGSA